ncbi:oligosaccharide flippase family protein [uncultured Fusobacterium sp.]|uniref:oligosaccharide flippase family protein n=1 Tax=uncultured Fusobacterium sp. TaxID=159267 RepID=UPI0025D691F1|nr:oligosaccharide flippase family protein [uncultured Fusobacterium sp.]
MGKSIIKNYLYNNILLIFNLIYPFFTMVYVNKIFSLETIGEISFALSIITVFISLSSLGIPVYGMREIAINRHDLKKMSKIFSELLTLNFISTIIFGIIYFIIIYFYIENSKNLQIYLILSINLLLNSFLLEWFYTGLEEYEYITKRNILVKIISFIFMIFFIKTEKDVNLYLIFLVLGTSLNGFFNIYNSKKYVKFSFIKVKLKDKIHGLKYFYFQVIIGIFYNGCDQIILGLQSTSTQVAYYARCRQLIVVPIVISSSFTKTLIPRINNIVNRLFVK